MAPPAGASALAHSAHSPRWHNRAHVETSLGPLLPLFERERAAGRALAVGLLVHTAGSTYRKPGALMLIAANGEYSGLLSGGCPHSHLREHAPTATPTPPPHTPHHHPPP